MASAAAVLSMAGLRAGNAAALLLALGGLGACGGSGTAPAPLPEQRLVASGSAWYAITPQREVLQARFNARVALVAGPAHTMKVIAVTSWDGDTVLSLDADGAVHASGDSGYAGTADCTLWWVGHAPMGDCPVVNGLKVADDVRDITVAPGGWLAVTRAGAMLTFGGNAAPRSSPGLAGIAKVIAVRDSVLGLGDDGNVYAFGGGMYAGTAGCSESAVAGVSCPQAQGVRVAEAIRELVAFQDGWLAVAIDGTVLRTGFNSRPSPVAGLVGIRKVVAIKTPSRVDHWDTPLGAYTIVALGWDGNVYASGSAANAGTASCVQGDGSLACPLVAGAKVAGGVRDIAPLGRPLYPRGWLAVMNDGTVRQAELAAAPAVVAGLAQIEEVAAIGGEATGTGEPVYTTIVGLRQDGSIHASGSAAYAGTASCTRPATPYEWAICPAVTGVQVY